MKYKNVEFFLVKIKKANMKEPVKFSYNKLF